MPILIATDVNTDVGKEAELYEYGFWCESGKLDEFQKFVELFSYDDELRIKMGMNGYNRLKNDFNVNYSYNSIMNHFND